MSQTSLRSTLLVYLVVACTALAAAQSLNDLQWTTDSTNRFVSVHGRRSAIFGYPETGLEIWAYPLQIVKSFVVSFRPEGSSSDVSGRQLLRRIVYSPESITRIYAGPDFIIREKLFVPLDEPGAILSYESEASRPIDIIIHFTPVLDLMWPASIGGQEAQWNSAASSYVISEPTRRFAASIGSPDIVAHDDTSNFNRPSASFAFTIRVNPQKTTKAIIAGGKSKEEIEAISKRLGDTATAVENSAAKHYSDLFTQSLHIETPDAEINRALAWSEIALDQAWVCNPDLGCGLVAGYGPSRRGRRPQYDWFFAGDGMVAVRGLLADGKYDLARQELEFILKYQDQQTGMIWHELSQSAAFLDWKNYPYMYLHVDLSFQFLSTFAEYYSVTGDLPFVKAHWNSIQSAHRYCLSLLEKDALPHIPSEKRGEREQEALSDELALSINWLTASQAFANLAVATDHMDLANQARATAHQLGPLIAKRYWDEAAQSWITGYSRSGAPLPNRGIGPVGVLEQLSLSSAQLNSVLDQLASANFQTDWGTRGNGSNSRTYDPNSYSSGSVWAVGTSVAATALWSEHRPATAFPIWRALVPWTSLDSLGHMHEALAGDNYHEELESVPEQTWSSSEFLRAAVSGLLGIQVDGEKNHVTFAPHIPISWEGVTLRHLRTGKSELTLTISHSTSEVRLQAKNDGPAVNFLFSPEIPLGAKMRSAQLGPSAIRATIQQNAQDSHAKIKFALPHGETSVTIHYEGGVTLIPDPPHPLVGDASQAIKVTGITLQGRTLTVDFDFVPSANSSFEIRTPWAIDKVQGGTLQSVAPGSYRCTVHAVAGGQEPRVYRHGKVSITLSGL